ncbi:MAG TPA: GGDEF domain-containing protein [Clostridium sp.]|nr:GGDEF domain-containing protein [Clostridium sp.]
MNYEDMDRETLIKILREKDIMLKRLCMERERLNYYAGTDVMTGVLNRRSGLELLNKEFNVSKMGNKNFVVCFVDVDELKTINDKFGHQEGDKVLIDTAEILKESIRKTDFIIRMGGDEFLMVFPETTIKEAYRIWNRIDRRLKKFNKNSKNYNLSLSFGFCEYKKGDKMSVESLIKTADFKMYSDKLHKKKRL